MKHAITATFCAGVFSLSLVTSADAALVSRLSGQAVYDTDLDITWLADANLAVSSSFGVTGIAYDGTMPWTTAQDWIAAMNADGGTGYLGFNDWRLPSTLQPDADCSLQPGGGVSYGYDCFGSEMGHLFYQELGGTAGNAVLTSGSPNLALFMNITYKTFWSGSKYAPDTSRAWDFSFNDGGQFVDLKSNYLNAWAVRSGDVAAVPVPGAAWLFGSGLAGLLAARWRRVR